PAGSAFLVLEMLGVDGKYPGTVTVMVNAPSSRYGLKDLVKLEGKELSRSELDKAALAAPYATVNVVRDYAVVEKFKLRCPAELNGLVKCPNARCITNREGKARLLVEEREPLRVRCSYCEKVFTAGELDLPGRQGLAAFTA
ncbi:MAG: aspartate carbamoyltransferase regulatory subunit, partial [Candidatus Micrarchaeota archaeon]